MYVTVDVESEDVIFVADTISSVSIMSSVLYKKRLSVEKAIARPRTKLLDYCRNEISVQGYFTTTIF